MTRAKRQGRSKRKLWVGFVDGRIHFYRDPNYYSGVLKADLFASKKAALNCYIDVRPFVPRKVG